MFKFSIRIMFVEYEIFLLTFIDVLSILISCKLLLCIQQSRIEGHFIYLLYDITDIIVETFANFI